MDMTPFKLDIDELLREFAKDELTSFVDMKKIWAAKKFTYIFEARPNANSAFFMQSLYAHAIAHMVSEDVLPRRLGGLYCLYCLYETQPYKPCFKIYISIGELRRLKLLVIDAKRNGIGVVPSMVKRMLNKKMFLFGFVETNSSSIKQNINNLSEQQNKRVQIAYGKLLSNTKIDEYMHMDLSSELGLESFKKMSTDYAKAKELALEEASKSMDIENIKHIVEDKRAVGKLEEDIIGEWNKQKEAFYNQTGIAGNNGIMVSNKGRDECINLVLENRNAGDGEREDIDGEWGSHEASYNEEGVLNRNETVEGDEFDEMADLCFDLRDLYDS